MADKKNIPEIRLNGFDGEWEEKKLSKIVDVCSGRDYKHLKQGNIPVYGTGGYMLSVNEALSYDTNAIGIGRKGTIDKPYVLKAPFWTVDTLFYCIPKENNHLDFVYDIFQNINWKQKNEATGVPSLSKVAINEISIYSTIAEEQSQIGTYFQNLDKLITLHQKKYDKLVILKKALLEKMFPKNGASVPEIRFKGFEGDWKKHELKNIAHDISDGNWIEANHIFDRGEYRIIQTGNLGLGEYLDKPNNAKFFHQSDFNEVRGNEIFPGDILISRLAEPAGRTTILPNTGFRMVTSVDVTIVRPDNSSFNSAFLMTQLNTKSILQAVNEKVSGTSHKRISRRNLEKTILSVPEIKEQQKIGTYFHKLDQSISLQQKQLDKLKIIKKACLEKMFV